MMPPGLAPKEVQPEGGSAGDPALGPMEPQLTRYWFGAQAYSHVQGPPLTNPLQSQVCAPSDAHEHWSPAGSWQSTEVRDARHPPGPRGPVERYL